MQIIRIDGSVYMFTEDGTVYIFSTSRNDWFQICEAPENKEKS